MLSDLIPATPLPAGALRLGQPAAMVAASGPQAAERLFEFFTVHIRNAHTRRAYATAVRSFFAFCQRHGVGRLQDVSPILVAAYVESQPASAPTRKQHLAAIRMLYDWLVVGQVVAHNPAAAVRGPRHKVKVGKTPLLEADQARTLLDSIPTNDLVGLRDRALIATMLYTFGRVGAVVAMRVEDYYLAGRRWRFRLHEKNGNDLEMPAHHKAEEYVDAYLEAAGIRQQAGTPLFRSVDSRRELTQHPLSQPDVFAMIRRRARQAGLPGNVGCHTMRATGITAYLRNGGRLEYAQKMAGHESARTTGLYDRRSEELTRDEIERIAI